MRAKRRTEKKRKKNLKMKMAGILILITGCIIGGYLLNSKVNATETTLKPVLAVENSTKEFVLKKEAVVQSIHSAGKLITQEMEIDSPPVEVTEDKSDSNFLNSMMLKKKTLVFAGKGYYYIDLTKITDNNITVDNTNKTVSIKLPSLEIGDISIDEDKCTASNTENGWFRFGEMTFTDEENKRIQKEAKQGILDKMETDEYLSKAKYVSRESFDNSLGKIIKKISDYKVIITL